MRNNVWFDAGPFLPSFLQRFVINALEMILKLCFMDVAEVDYFCPTVLVGRKV